MHSLNSDSHNVERKGIEGTPFQLIRYQNKHHLAWGEYALTNRCDTEEEAIRLLETDVWNIIGIYTISILDMRKKIEETYGTQISKIVDLMNDQTDEQGE